MKWPSFFRTIQAKLIIIYVLLILIAMQLIGVYFVSAMKNSLTSNFTKDLQERAELLSVLAADKLGGTGDTGENNPVESLGAIVNNLFNLNGAEIQVLDASGKVLITSYPSHADYVGKKNTQTVVSRALQGIKDNEEYVIDEDNVRKKVVAKPVMNNGKIVGAIYIVASMKELYDTMGRVNNIFISGILLALGMTCVLGVILAHTITHPIKEMTNHATAVAEGSFDQKMPVFGNDEIGQLSEAFNYMTSRLREALIQNEEEKEKLASILTNMSDGVIATDEAGKVILMNRRAGAILGVDEDELAGSDIAQVLGLTPEQADTFTEGTYVTMLLQISPEEEKEKSRHYMVRVTFTPIHRREFGITGTIAVLQDVTEQEKLEASRREFVANVSHELRTPLTTIKSYTEALDDGALDDPPLAARFVGVIQNETERMIRLVTDLLHLSRLDNKEALLRKQPTDVLEMLEDVSDRFSFQMQQKGIQAEVRVEEGVQKAPFDRDQIDQVLDNLVSNALKYTPSGGSITMEAALTEGRLLAISVQDTGIGIPKKDLDRIFERFYRVDKARSRNMGGTGLGLSIAREIVLAHGGTISLQSELGQGTKVTFTLPLGDEGGSPS
ncbi:cell wall metabolism sensor histidine kinase WalK [Paenibacillus cellulositrophicus]|uniref:cell wall metabolism sensor histidine kinase WalK n=1 Tax=Paenibacillus cellulositrophicus TaxID=562959 RepID=UPI00203CAB4E|nr:cell wall metabolism sensor histidine kinase WalK [Paenibacillus cellulositrophicus]MCM3001096.1 cell wall metabolism sensor histidine kinase WalK [Paenibacillus cellulositrophicus]